MKELFTCRKCEANYNVSVPTLECPVCGWKKRDKPMSAEKVEVGDVIQLIGSPSEVNPSFNLCLLTVSEVKPWGVQAYVTVPGRNGISLAFYRAATGTFQYVGKAVRQAENEGD